MRTATHVAVRGAPATAASGAGPVTEEERAEVLDALRGFALLGIFLAHVPGFSGWDYLAPTAQAALDPGSDGALQFLRDTFVRGKFYSLFSLLFGVGFAIQLAGTERRGEAFAARFRRRQLGLLALGIGHSALWHGDILLTYALLGLFLVPFAATGPRRLLQLALACFALRGAWGLLTYALAGSLAPFADATVGGGGDDNLMGHVPSVMAGYYSAEWSEMLLANARFLRLKWLLVLYEGKLFSIAGFFLLGAAFGRWRLHEGLAAHVRELRRCAWLAFAIGIPGNLALALLWPDLPRFPPTPLGVVTNLAYAVAVPSLALGMAAGVALLWQRPAPRRALRAFVAPGRMALTTYLIQTAIGIGLFYGVGLGARGSVSLTTALAIALLVFALQAVLARAWLQRFRYGPFEWAWRCATYGRWLPLARRPPQARPA